MLILFDLIWYGYYYIFESVDAETFCTLILVCGVWSCFFGGVCVCVFSEHSFVEESVVGFEGLRLCAG